MKYLYKQEKILLGTLVSICIVSLLTTIYLVKNQAGLLYQNQRGNIKILDARAYSTRGPMLWNQLAKNLADEYQYYSRFIVLVPNQEIPHVSSTLSYMLENLGKPVLVTDPDDVQEAITRITKTKIPEVMILDKGHLHRAVNTGIKLTGKNALALPEDPFQVKFIDDKIRIPILKSNQVPDPDLVKDPGNVKGMVIVTGPKINKKLLKIIPELTDKGVTVLITGEKRKKLAKTGGVVSPKDIDDESARAKLYYLCSHVKDPVLLSKLITKNFRGEISE